MGQANKPESLEQAGYDIERTARSCSLFRFSRALFFVVFICLSTLSTTCLSSQVRSRSSKNQEDAMASLWCCRVVFQAGRGAQPTRRKTKPSSFSLSLFFSCYCFKAKRQRPKKQDDRNLGRGLHSASSLEKQDSGPLARNMSTVIHATSCLGDVLSGYERGFRETCANCSPCFSSLFNFDNQQISVRSKQYERSGK